MSVGPPKLIRYSFKIYIYIHNYHTDIKLFSLLMREQRKF